MAIIKYMMRFDWNCSEKKITYFSACVVVLFCFIGEHQELEHWVMIEMHGLLDTWDPWQHSEIIYMENKLKSDFMQVTRKSSDLHALMLCTLRLDPGDN